MKIKNIFFILIVSICPIVRLGASKTFLSSRTLATNALLELALTDNEFRNMCNDENLFVLHIKPVYQRSVNKTDLARYFLPNNNCCIDIEENGSGDVDSIWLNLVAPLGVNSFYSSQVCIEPQRTVAGVIITAFLDLGCLFEGLWVGFNMGIASARHSLNLEECNRTEEGAVGDINNFCDAVNQPDWCYGKLACRSLHRSGVDDIQLKLCYQMLTSYYADFSMYAVTTIPTGKRPTSNYLFEPLVGTKNPSIGLGFNAMVCETTCNDRVVSILGDFKYRYVFKSREMRSFDLTPNGDWSRYLLVVTPDQLLSPTPAINQLTFNTQVTPGSTVELWTAAHYQHCNMHLEVGYNLWWRDTEDICTLCPIALERGIFDMGGFCSLASTTSSTANISQGPRGDNAALSNDVFTAITQANINLLSAAQPRVFSNSFYLAAAYEVSRYCIPVTLAFGASYEIPNSTNNGFRQWTLWGTLGFSF